MQRVISLWLVVVISATPLVTPLSVVYAADATASATPAVTPTPTPFIGPPSPEIIDAPTEDATSSSEVLPAEPTPSPLPTPEPTPITLPEQFSEVVGAPTEPTRYELGQTTELIDPQSLLPSLDTRSPTAASARPPVAARMHQLFKKSLRVNEVLVVDVDHDVTSQDIRVEVVDRKERPVLMNIRQTEESQSTTEYHIAPKGTLQPGKYTVRIYENNTLVSSEDFRWGVLAINTNKSIYAPSDMVRFDMAVLDDTGDMVCDAKLKLDVTDPNGVKTTITTSEEATPSSNYIRVSPLCTSHTITLDPDYEAEMGVEAIGKYTMNLTAETKNGQYSITDSFIVDPSALFDVERKAATRIYPPQTYPVFLSVTAKQDFTGEIVETVPAGFAVSKVTGVRPYDSVNVVVSDPYRLIATASGQVVNIRMPFDGNYDITLPFGDQVTDEYLKGKYTSFGLSGHDGTDFALPEGTPVYAVDDGVVARAENEPYGLTVILQHDWGRSYYGHLRAFAVRGLQHVRRGDLLGYSGQTGLATGPHLHFGMRLNSFDMSDGYYGKVDPLPYLTSSTVPLSSVSVKKIRWNVSMYKGQQMMLGYAYHAPHESPQFYLTGPLEIDGVDAMTGTWTPSPVTPESTQSGFINPFVLGLSDEATSSAEASVSAEFVGPISPPSEASGSAEPQRISFAETRQWQIASDTIVTFTSVGVTNWNVPTGVTSIRIKAWGGGGGGGGGGTAGGGGEGGGAAFATGLVSVTAGEQLNIRVGGGGGGGDFSSGGGGDYSGDGGGGGARSYVQRNSDSTYFTIAAGGGGGGGGDNSSSTEGGDGGPGGTTTGVSGSASGSTTGATGGGQSSGGTGGNSSGGADGASGGSDSGGNAGNPTSTNCVGDTSGAGGAGGIVNGGTGGTGDGGTAAGCGGGGGGANGYYGGGGGGASTPSNAGGSGGGGGSSYLTGTETASSAAGSGQTAGGSTDEDYASDVGTGGNGGGTSADGSGGGDGRVVIWYSTAPANNTQIHYRWRNDDGNEVAATWFANEDTRPNVPKATNKRLRFEISNEGDDTSGALDYRLEVSGPDPATCASGTYTRVDTDTHWDVVSSTNITDGAATTNVASGLTDENTTFVAGQTEETSDQLASTITITERQFTEIEYVLQATSSSTEGSYYCFRLTDAGSTTNFTYSQYAEAYVQPVDNPTQIHYRWRNDDGIEGGSIAGDGADGALAPAGTFNMNTSTSGARSYADGIVYKVDPATATTSGAIVKLYDTPNGLAAGDDVLLINLQGATGDTADVGNYELFTVQSVSTSAKTVTFTSNIANSYDGSTPGNQKVALQRVPNYTTVTLDSTDSITASAWDGLAPHISGAVAYYSGIVAFKANSTVTVATGTSITVDGLGYRGGAGGSTGGGVNGESYDGSVGSGGNDTTSGSGGGAFGTSGGGSSSNAGPSAAPYTVSPSGTRGGGGGGGNTDGSATTDGAGGGAGGGHAGGGGGGGGGGDALSGSAGGTGGGTDTVAGGGGAAGDNAIGGAGGNAGSAGAGAATTAAAGSGATTGEGGNGGISTSTGIGAGGGGGGGLYGAAALTDIFLGSGGGGGGGHDNGPITGATGGNGGGIIFVIADTINMTSTGTLTSDGAAGGQSATARGGSSGGGAGGSIMVKAYTLSLGTNLVTATGGSGGAQQNPGGGGGSGGVGRIRVEGSSTPTVTTDPAASTGTFTESTGASWLADQDTWAYLSRNVTKRLRFEISSEGSGSTGALTYRLEVSEANPASCTTATYTRLDTDAAWDVVASSYLTDGAATTNVGGLTDENTTFVAGQVEETSDTLASSITLSSTEFTEIEYALQPTSSAVAQADYCFRLTNSGSTTHFTYTQYAQATISSPYNTQAHYRWRNDDTSTWWDSDWSRRKTVTIDNSSNSSTLTNYQVKVTVAYDSDMQADFDDIRFTTIGQTPTELDYWLEAKTDSTTATFWVEVPTVTGSTTTTIDMYYGNSDVSTTSSLDNTFRNANIYLETRNCDDATNCYFTDSHAEFDDIITAEYTYRGSGYVTQVNATEDPYSASEDHFFMRYRYLFRADTTGTHNFAVNSDDASELHRRDLGDTDSTHTVTAYWYGGHAAGTCGTSGTTGAISLTSGDVVWFEYRMTEWEGDAVAQTCVQEPSGSYTTLTTANFANQLFAREITSPEPSNSAGSEETYTTGQAERASWAADEDTRLTDIAKETTKRLRIEVSNEGQETSTDATFRLEVSAPNPDSCSTATYTRVASDTNWAITDSTYITDAEATTNITGGLTDENASFVAGQFKDDGDQTGGITLTTTDFTEIEYSLRATTFVNYGVYCFRVTNAGATNEAAYNYYAEVYLGPELAELMRHGNWFLGNVEQYFSF